MSESEISITFANRSQSSRDCVLIEQEPWGRDVGETSNMQGILAISAAVSGGRWPEVNCAGSNGEFNATVYVYTCDDVGLDYQFKVSHGTVSMRVTEIMYREEVVQCSLQLEHELDYPVRSVGAMSWIGNCYDSGGSVTSRPIVTIQDDNTVLLSKKVWGSLRVRYTVLRHTYHVTIQRRWAALENKYNSVAYAVWDGGVKWLDIEAPTNFEAFDGDCGNGAFYNPNLQDGYNDGQLSQTDICKPEYTKLPVAVTADRMRTVEYCSQETLSDTTNETTDYEQMESECDE